MLQADGWYLVATRGRHRQFKHRSKSGRVTVPGKPSDAILQSVQWAVSSTSRAEEVRF